MQLRGSNVIGFLYKEEANMKIAFLSDGRDWAYFIAKELLAIKNKKWNIDQIVTTPEILFPRYPIDRLRIQTKIIDPKELLEIYSEAFFDGFDILLFYGWSWIVPAEIVKTKICICLHPSPLPKYRGGSPIQHQIINGETESMVSLFQMTEKLDDGPVYKQKPLSLEGHLKDIIHRIGDVGLNATIEMLDELADGKLKPIQQNESQATVYKRRKKSESELTEEKLRKMGSTQLFNFICSLEDPYPNAYTKIADGKIFFKRVEITAVKEQGNILSVMELKNINKDQAKKLLEQNLILKCIDGGHIEIQEAIVE